jgi:hypothetical protein
MLVGIAVVLQLISILAGKYPKQGFTLILKRHQSYLHPLYSVIVMTVAWWSFVFLASRFTPIDIREVWGWVYSFGIVFAALVSGRYVLQMVKESRVRA